MAEPPRHDFCGTNHWSTQPCPGMKAGKETEAKPAKVGFGGKCKECGRLKEQLAALKAAYAQQLASLNEVVAQLKQSSPAPASKEVKIEDLKAEFDGFDKKAYQRELMRKRRAAAKEKS